MGSGLKKKKAEQMTAVLRNKEEEKAFLWGLRNGVHISPFAASESKWWIDIEVKGEKVRSPGTYDGKTIWKKVFELYLFYFNKYN